MRVIGGELKRRLLKGPKTARIRPVLDKVKGAIFNILGDVTGSQVLDLFAGSGSLGIEALSRGAAGATFVDDLKEAVTIMRENLKGLGLMERSEILCAGIKPALHQLSQEGHGYDLIFVDPPYDRGLVETSLKMIAELDLLNPGGRIVTEHSPRECIPSFPSLQLEDVRRYGQTRVSFFTREET